MLVFFFFWIKLHAFSFRRGAKRSNLGGTHPFLYRWTGGNAAHLSIFKTLGFSDGLSSPHPAPRMPVTSRITVLHFLFIRKSENPYKPPFLGCYSGGRTIQMMGSSFTPESWTQDAGVIRVNPAQVRWRGFSAGGDGFFTCELWRFLKRVQPKRFEKEMMVRQWKNSLGICSANMRMHWRSASISPSGFLTNALLACLKWMFNQWWKYKIGSSGMMRLVVFSSLYRQMIHRPPKLNMGTRSRSDAFQDLGGGELTSQPTIAIWRWLAGNMPRALLNCQAVDMHGHGALWHFGVAAGGRSSALLVFPIIKWVSLSINTCQRLAWVG